MVVALIAIIPATFMAALAWKSSRDVGRNVDTLRIEINSRVDQLVEASEDTGELKGREYARAEADQRRKRRVGRENDNHNNEPEEEER